MDVLDIRFSDGITASHSLYPRQMKLEGGILDSPCPSVRPSVCRRHGFRSISQVCFGISISYFICMLMVAISRSLLIFSYVTFKMAAWQPYWMFWFLDSNFTLALIINFKLQRHNTYVYGYEPFYFEQRHFQNGRLAAILDLLVSRLCRWHGFRSVSLVSFGISISNFICMLIVVIGSSHWFSVTSLSKWPPGGHIGFFCFQTLTLVWLWISTPNLSGTILMYMCRSLVIFSNVDFKMAARQPYWIFLFPDSNFSLVSISTPNLSGTILIYIYIWVGAYWFSATSLSKWPPGDHIGFFGFRTNFSLALNINSKLQWQNTYLYG